METAIEIMQSSFKSIADFDTKEVFDFCLENGSEIIQGEDWQFYHYIRLHGKRICIATDIHPLSCLWNGIKIFNNLEEPVTIKRESACYRLSNGKHNSRRRDLHTYNLRKQRLINNSKTRL